MKTRDHEKIIRSLDERQHRREQKLIQEIKRLRHIIELMHDGQVDLSIALYNEYLGERSDRE